MFGAERFAAEVGLDTGGELLPDAQGRVADACGGVVGEQTVAFGEVVWLSPARVRLSRVPPDAAGTTLGCLRANRFQMFCG